MLRHRHSRPTPPQRLVVLGGTGFVGQAVVAAAQREGIAAISVGSRDLDLTHPESGARLASLLTADDCLLFLSEVGSGLASGSDALVRDIAMAQAVASAVKMVKVDHLTYVSSDGVYPFSCGLISELSPAAPETLYGLMHRTRELMLAREVGAPLSVLRLTGTYGPLDRRDPYGPDRFLRQALAKGEITVNGGGEEHRHHIFVEDAARLILLVITHRSEGLLNLAGGGSVTFWDLAHKVARLTGALIVTAERRIPVTHRWFDPTVRAAAFPSFAPLTLDEGLERTLAGLRSQK